MPTLEDVAHYRQLAGMPYASSAERMGKGQRIAALTSSIVPALARHFYSATSIGARVTTGLLQHGQTYRRFAKWIITPRLMVWNLNADFIILDEGLVMSMIFSHENGMPIEKVLAQGIAAESVDRERFYIFIELPIELEVERYRNRFKTRLGRYSDEQLCNQMRRSNSIIREMVHHFQNSERNNYITIRGADTMETNLVKSLSWLKSNIVKVGSQVHTVDRI